MTVACRCSGAMLRLFSTNMASAHQSWTKSRKKLDRAMLTDAIFFRYAAASKGNGGEDRDAMFDKHKIGIVSSVVR